MATARARGNVLATGLLGLALTVVSLADVAGQEQFQFIVSATDAEGKPVTDLTRAEVVMKENGVANEIVKGEPFRIPVKLTLAIDNGPLSRDALSHYRSGLEALVRALPIDEVEVAIITTAPQPRRVGPPTIDRARRLGARGGDALDDGQ